MRLTSTSRVTFGYASSGAFQRSYTYFLSHRACDVRNYCVYILIDNHYINSDELGTAARASERAGCTIATGIGCHGAVLRSPSTATSNLFCCFVDIPCFQTVYEQGRSKPRVSRAATNSRTIARRGAIATWIEGSRLGTPRVRRELLCASNKKKYVALRLFRDAPRRPSGFGLRT